MGAALGGIAAAGALGKAYGATLPARPFDPIALDAPVSLWDLPTPALVEDVEALESNLDKMASEIGD
jgi:hypothetical protein